MTRLKLPRLARTVAIVMALALGAWGALAISVSGPEPGVLRLGLAGGFGLLWVAALVQTGRRSRRRAAMIVLAFLVTLLLAWWSSIRPSNSRDWAPSVALLPHASVKGDLVTMHNVRHFIYRSETDFTPAYDDRTYDLSKLEAVDLVAVYWMGPAIAHVFVSFAFEGGQHLAISIETRNERDEPYSTLKGFFRQYELTYVVADERDVIALRTNYRNNPPEDVYVFRVLTDRTSLRQFFVQYVNEINALKDRPEFYNTLTTNCTTNIWMHTTANPGHLPFNWKILASGYVPQYLYDQGRLQTDGVTFDALQARAHVNARARSQPSLDGFSRRIRSPQEARP